MRPAEAHTVNVGQDRFQYACLLAGQRLQFVPPMFLPRFPLILMCSAVSSNPGAAYAWD